MSPKKIVALLTTISWLRAQMLGAMLKEEVERAETRSGGVKTGLVGKKTSASSVVDGIYPTGEEILALTRLEGAERDRCAKLAMDAHNMGLTGDSM